MTEQTKSYRIVRLQASNVKRLEAVDITPDGDIVRITGKNGQGKTSVLDSILYALGGGRTLPSRPIRDGADKASIEVDLGSLKVRRTITAGGSQLVVEQANGARFSSPQSILDQLVGELTMDPLAFCRMKPAEQAAQLRDLVGLGEQFAKLDSDRDRAYQDRRDANRDVKRLEAQLSQYGAAETVERVDVSKLAAELRAANERNAQADNALRTIDDLGRRVDSIDDQIATLKARRAELVAEREALEAVPVERVDTADLEARLEQADEINERAAMAERRASVAAELKEARAIADKHDATIKAIDEEKRAALSAAEFPLKGLSFDADGVALNGVPLDQASGAERLRAAMAIAIAANPRLRVIRVTDASLLDDDSMRAVEQFAAQNDCQVWLEMVGEHSAPSVVIEDGRVRVEEDAA